MVTSTSLFAKNLLLLLLAPCLAALLGMVIGWLVLPSSWGINHAAAPVYIGLALAVCAGSSLFSTAATAGPLMQTLVERAGLKDLKGERLSFGFREFVPVDLLGFSLILSIAIAPHVMGDRLNCVGLSYSQPQFGYHAGSHHGANDL